MWKKQGLIYSCDFYGTGYAQDAFVDKLSNDVWRIYYSTRTKDVISYPYYIDVEAGNFKKIINIARKPIVDIGKPGTFDDCGITMTSIVKINDCTKYLYYCGWNRKTTVSYSLSIGCIKVLNDNIFEKLFEGPILERSVYNLCGVSAPMVIYDTDVYRMWYIAFTSWEEINGKLEPIYVVKHAVSNNGVDWRCDNHICIDSSYPGESVGRPWVIKDNNVYKMWFSTRGIHDYRHKNGEHYTIGYAESLDGLNWERKDSEIKESCAGWDSEMMEYASVIKHNNKYFMLYNGNNFGKDGFGLAIRESY